MPNRFGLLWAISAKWKLVAYGVLFLFWGAALLPDASVWESVLVSAIIAVSAWGTVPEFAPFQLLGLPAREWQKLRKVHAGFFLLPAAISALVAQWWIALPTVAIVGLIWFRPGEPERKSLLERLPETEGRTDNGIFPGTPPAQIVYRPLVRSWLTVWAVAGLVAITLGIIDHFWNWTNPIAVAAGVTGVQVPIVMDTVRQTWRDNLAFGGTRRSWANAVWLTGWLSVALALFLGGLEYLLGYCDIWQVVFVAFWIAPIAVTLELISKKNWWAFAAVLVMLAISISAWVKFPGWGMALLGFPFVAYLIAWGLFWVSAGGASLGGGMVRKLGLEKIS
ncbi:hypothetical protein [uncultured Corynebacterium sp.]|uniref:hypothetical protein n=1 Tax=uncultured Corynebacterium sp. TaxID=159447 RepID=UPI0025D1B231|nr:hypothetical protein [uncultured Corynebacterium sp.]